MCGSGDLGTTRYKPDLNPGGQLGIWSLQRNLLFKQLYYACLDLKIDPKLEYMARSPPRKAREEWVSVYPALFQERVLDWRLWTDLQLDLEVVDLAKPLTSAEHYLGAEEMV